MMEWTANVAEEILDFSKVLNASISTSWLILVVVLLRFLLKKAPKWIHVALWGVVAVRLLLPFSIESAFSLIPSAETVPQEILRYEGARLQESAYFDVISNPVFDRDTTVQIGQTVDRLQTQMGNMTFIWLMGMVVLLLYTAFSYGSLRRKVSEAVILQDNIFQSENVTSPFVLGILRPRIYLPYKMNGQDLKHVVAHEQAHIRRKDHWWKPLGFLLLTIHWFNPLMWLAYVLLCRDIELACDEKVIKELGNEQRADYTQALVTCSVNRRTITACPLAFGEVGVRERVKSVMNYKKPAFWSVILALVACAVTAVCFLTNPLTSVRNPWVQEYIPAPGTEIPATGPAPQEAQRFDDTEIPSAKEDALDAAVSAAILSHYAGDSPDGLVNVESHVLLANESKSGTPQIGVSNYMEEVTVYLLVLHEKYSTYDGILDSRGGSYVPTAITFSISEAGEYTLKEYWEPRDGSYYTKDIQAKFPDASAEDALNDQAYIEDLQAQNYNKALSYLNSTGGLNIRIRELLDEICVSPGTASAPAQYIEAHDAEYQELLSYGEYTLKYCFAEFLSGDQNDLRGHIMAAVCEEISGTWGEPLLIDEPAPATGQDWFDAFNRNARSLADQLSNEKMEKNYPASWILMQLIEE